jgi:hypothetical protein
VMPAGGSMSISRSRNIIKSISRSRGRSRGRSRSGSRKGITMVYDAVFACIILFVGMALAASSLPPAPPRSAPDLQGYATSLLVWMDSKGVLAPYIYTQDQSGLASFLDRLAPAGYCVKVYSPDWTLLWTCTSPSFDPGNAAASQPYPLSGYQGVPDPKIVVLLLSK